MLLDREFFGHVKNYNCFVAVLLPLYTAYFYYLLMMLFSLILVNLLIKFALLLPSEPLLLSIRSERIRSSDSLIIEESFRLML